MDGEDSAVSPELAGELVNRVAGIHARGWCEATSGNYSLVIGREPLRVLVTRSGVDKAKISADDLIVVSDDATPLEDFSGEPSAEVLLHLTLAREAGAAAVLHSHSVWGTLLGERFREEGGFHLEGYEMLKAFEGINSHEARVFIPVLENSQEMSHLAVKLQDLLVTHTDTPGFLIAGHGLYTWGPSLEAATRHLEALEFLFQVVGRRVRVESFSG